MKELRESATFLASLFEMSQICSFEIKAERVFQVNFNDSHQILFEFLITSKAEN